MCVSVSVCVCKHLDTVQNHKVAGDREGGEGSRSTKTPFPSPCKRTCFILHSRGEFTKIGDPKLRPPNSRIAL